ncbi:MAG: M28 family peptidase [Planctomycetota bacterium]
MFRLTTGAVGGAMMLASLATAANEIEPSPWFAPDRWERQLEYEAGLNTVPSPETLRLWHDQMCSEPHPAGTAADRRMIAYLQESFINLGLDTDVHEFEALLSRPISASLAIVDGDTREALAITERAVVQDADSGHPDLDFGWNAYAATGSVTAPVVYVNYGSWLDFKKLDALGVSCEGKIVLARYGRNFRGYKVKFAEERGAAGVIMFTDPADSGKGPGYPEGGWANETSIQRGSIKTLAYPGDPQTPGSPAHPGAQRIDEDALALPTIPVQPIGWAAAEKILSRMTGDEVPSHWQGGLDFTYRVSCDSTIVELNVEQERAVTPCANVLGVLEGTRWPDQLIVIGCHFDAWSFGAGDPHAGSIVLMEMARSFANLARADWRPERTIVFANWGAEEFGIIGSTEWVEANRDRLTGKTVAYINLDMAAMGPNFRSSASPSLRPIIEEVTHAVEAADRSGRTVWSAWTDEGSMQPSFGTLGGGSDHVGFYLHMGIPCASLGGSGSEGVSYHSNYDSLTWYRSTVGNDYQPAKMITMVGNVLVARLANADILPIDPRAYDDHLDPLLWKQIDEIPKLANVGGTRKSLSHQRIAALYNIGLANLRATTDITMTTALAGLADGTLTERYDLEAFNDWLIAVESLWLDPNGLPGRPWYRSTYAATDPRSGYGAMVMPGILEGLHTNSIDAIDAAVRVLQQRMDRIVGTAGDAHRANLDAIRRAESQSSGE